MITRTARPRPISKDRARERRLYNARREQYLLAHPFDQILIAIRGFSEAAIIAADGWWMDGNLPRRIPRSNQIHHRNKTHGDRLLDERWWMATGISSHDYIENNKAFARAEGYLLPIQADIDGRWGAGNQALTTPELMASKLQ